MRDLLPENIALLERLEALPSREHALKELEVREIGTLTTWVSAFTTYLAIVAEVHPYRVKDECLHAHSHLGGTEIWRKWVDYLRRGVPMQQDRSRS